jgi:hypothetical protein
LISGNRALHVLWEAIEKWQGKTSTEKKHIGIIVGRYRIESGVKERQLWEK